MPSELIDAIRRAKKPLFIVAVFAVGWANGVGMGWEAARVRYADDFLIGQAVSAPWWVNAAPIVFVFILIVFIGLSMPYLPRTR